MVSSTNWNCRPRCSDKKMRLFEALMFSRRWGAAPPPPPAFYSFVFICPTYISSRQPFTVFFMVLVTTRCSFILLTFPHFISSVICSFSSESFFYFRELFYPSNWSTPPSEKAGVWLCRPSWIWAFHRSLISPLRLLFLPSIFPTCLRILPSSPSSVCVSDVNLGAVVALWSAAAGLR